MGPNPTACRLPPLPFTDLSLTLVSETTFLSGEVIENNMKSSCRVRTTLLATGIDEYEMKP